MAAASGGLTAASTIEIDEFLNGALVSWVESCLMDDQVICGYASLLDGQIIHNVWLQIDPEPQHTILDINNLTGAALCLARTKNYESILRNLKQLFEDEFRQTILTLPECYTLGYYPDSKQGLEQMKLLLTLLLGAAVQCPNKEHFIGRIKQLDVDTQHAIVELIKQVTDNQSLVLTEESVELLSPINMYNHISCLTKERDAIYLKWISVMCKEPDLNTSANDDGVLVSTSLTNGLAFTHHSSSFDKNHLAVELADLKSKLRKLRQELEDKSECQLELREELAHKASQYEKLRLESQEWYAEAKRASVYRDEVDVLRERAEKADRLEIEVQKLKEKLTDSEFYKSRVEELREDNRMLLETKEMLEEQLQRWRKRSEHVVTLESEIIKYKQKLNDLALERDSNRSRLEELLEENTQLQLVTKKLNINVDADKSLSDIDDDCNSGDNSLSEQLTNNAQTKVLKLELENRRLIAALEQLKESSFQETSNKVLELEKERKKLYLKAEKLQENIQHLSQQNTELEDLFKNALEENKKMQDVLDQRNGAYDKLIQERDLDRGKIIDLEKHVEILKKEKQHIQKLNESIQGRADDLERTLDTRTKEMITYTEKLKSYDSDKQIIYDLQGKLNTFERENASLLRELNKLKENLEEKSILLDEKNGKIETQIEEINRYMKLIEESEQVRVRLSELEVENQELVSQHKIDLQTISTLRNDLVSGTLASNKVRSNLEKLGLHFDPCDGNAELSMRTVVEKLVRNPETFKTVREILLNISKEHDILDNASTKKTNVCILCHQKEIYTVEKNIDVAPSTIQESNSHTYKHTVRLNPSIDTIELAKLSEATSKLDAANSALQSTNDQLQNENARYKVDVATLGSQITSLNNQQVALQMTNTQLTAQKDALFKENETLKQKQQNLLHDQVTLQCLHDQLSSEYESLNKDKEHLKMILRDARNESRELRDYIATLESQINELKGENLHMKNSGEDLANLRSEHTKLKDDFRSLFATSDRFKNEYKSIQELYKKIRLENNTLKLQNTELNNELIDRNDRMKILEFQSSHCAKRCELLMQQNFDIDTERKTLMENVSHLLKQYRELLTFSLEDKKHYHEEEKSYTECVHNLHRQKEKLEEKIMELFKKSESAVAKKKPFGSNFVRRVKKASTDLINKVPTRNRRSWIDDSRLSQSQFIIGSESGGNDSDNSNEEICLPTDGHILQRNISGRQSLQRDLLDNHIPRGGKIRSSLQIQQNTDLNHSRSMQGLDVPDVMENSLTLAAAGSRRTVYLIDESQKIPENNKHQHIQLVSSATDTGVASSDSSSNSTLDASNNLDDKKGEIPATFLIYNRINSNVCNSPIHMNNKSESSCAIDSQDNREQQHHNNSDADNKFSRKRNDDKNNSIWYEYGCV